VENIITLLANKVRRHKYPLTGEHHYSDYDIEVIVACYEEVKKRIGEKK
jgi:hypothetical protein